MFGLALGAGHTGKRIARPSWMESLTDEKAPVEELRKYELEKVEGKNGLLSLGRESARVVK